MIINSHEIYKLRNLLATYVLFIADSIPLVNYLKKTVDLMEKVYIAYKVECFIFISSVCLTYFLLR